MSKCRIIFFLLICCPNFGSAQIQLNFNLKHKRYLQFEPIRAEIRVRNHMGNAIYIGNPGDKVFLRVSIFDTHRKEVNPTGRPLLKQLLPVPALEEAAQEIDLLSSFSIRESGTYNARAEIVFKNKVFTAPKVYFEVSSGMVLRQLETFEPSRIFTLRQTNRDFQDVLLLRVDSEDGAFCYGVYELGRLLKGFDPEIRLDADNNVHVLHQILPYQFHHSVFTPVGKPMKQLVHNASGAQPPDFVSDGEGGLTLNGALPDSVLQPVSQPVTSPQAKNKTRAPSTFSPNAPMPR